MIQNDPIAAPQSHATRADTRSVVKPHIFCIEGPAGSGKTTLCRALLERCEHEGISSSYTPEFSSTPLGDTLAQFLARFVSKPAWLSAEAIFMYCIADKFASLAVPIAEDRHKIVIADRGFITQSVLEIPNMVDPVNILFSQQMLILASDWLQSKFEINTFLLNLPLEENIRRLSERLKRPLSTQERNIMQRERESYTALAEGELAKILGVQVIDSMRAPELIAEDILVRFSVYTWKH